MQRRIWVNHHEVFSTGHSADSWAYQPDQVNHRRPSARTSSPTRPSRSSGHRSTSGDEADDARTRARMATISTRHLGAIRDTVEELQELGFVPKASVEHRAYGSAPQFKAYILNDEDMFFGYYPVQERRVHDDEGDLTIYDSAGKDAELFHHADDGDPDAIGTLFVAQTRRWFDSVWTTIARTTT